MRVSNFSNVIKNLCKPNTIQMCYNTDAEIVTLLRKILNHKKNQLFVWTFYFLFLFFLNNFLQVVKKTWKYENRHGWHFLTKHTQRFKNKIVLTYTKSNIFIFYKIYTIQIYHLLKIVLLCNYTYIHYIYMFVYVCVCMYVSIQTLIYVSYFVSL